MGGGSQLDIPENLLSLCYVCHDKAHRGVIPRFPLLCVIANREGKTPDGILAIIHGKLRE